MLVDSHCHLDFPDFAPDRTDVMRRARQAGVGYMVTICTRMADFPTILELAEADARLGCSLGVHPHNAGEDGDVPADTLVAMAAPEAVVGIGETGLDYYYDNAPRHAQQDSFRRHIDAARQRDLPLIVHTRDAEEDTIAILREELADGPVRGLIHCFTGTAWLAEQALDLGFYISASGIVTFKKATELRAVIADVPKDRLLVETDAPYLAPTPHRGKRNEPAFVAHTAAVVAELQGVSPGELAAVTTDNFFRLFSRAVRPPPLAEPAH